MTDARCCKRLLPTGAQGELPDNRFGGIDMEVRRKIGLVACLILAASLGSVAVSPATASDLSDLESVEVPMTAVRIDADVAAENGYEVRTDAQGYQYSVLIGTPIDAPYDGPRVPGDNVKPDDGASTRGVTTGNCGTSYLYINWGPKTMLTGYSINSGYGLPVSHNWIVYLEATGGIGFYDFGGFAPWGGASWNASRSINETGGFTHAQVTTGTVYTASGYVCFSGGPHVP